jgi:hypothetical protein
MRKIQKYSEAIYGNMATVYHRTSCSNLINAVYTEGFKPGEGDMYGKGFYATYDLESQEHRGMSDAYGPIVIKFAVPTEHFFFFDWEEFSKTQLAKKLRSSREDFIYAQANHFNISLTHIVVQDHETNYSSDMALAFIKETDIQRKVKGIIFTGRRDGYVLVAYDTKLLMPLSFRVDGEKEFSKVERNKEYLKQVLQRKLTPFETKDEPAFMKWLRKAKLSDYIIDEDPKTKELIWREGNWLDGVWEDGVWKLGAWTTGTWKSGTWEDGFWDNGFWIKGTWKSGTWENGTWANGIWTNGNWGNGLHQDGLWLKGTWYAGQWLDGTWNDGIWRSGLWKNGTWKDGIWNSGTWEDGKWIIGWIKDVDRKGNFKSDWQWNNNFVRSPINPKEYFKRSL